MRVGLLAGTAEARALAQRLADDAIPTVASLADATRDPEALAVPTRRGGFGGEAGLADWLAGEGITALLDATHPFACTISHRAARVARACGVAHRQLLRPGWVAGPGDRWTRVAREEEAAGIVPPGATVFLATGRQTLMRFAALDARLICRRIDPPCAPFPLPRGEWLVGRPPFTVEGEAALLRSLGADWLVVKDSGGAASRPKLDAARALGLPVIVIDRPPQPDSARVSSVEEAMAWICSLTAPA